MRKILFALAAALPVIAGAAAQDASVEVKNAWARATPEKSTSGAAYLTVESTAGDRLTGADTPIAKAELMDMKMEGSVMKMRAVPGIDLPAGRPVALKPGAMHVMLEGLKQPLRAGESFTLTLHFAKSGTRQVEVAVEKLGAAGADKASGGMSMPMPAHH